MYSIVVMVSKIPEKKHWDSPNRGRKLSQRATVSYGREWMITAENVMNAAIPYPAKSSVRYLFMWCILKVDVIGFIVDFLNHQDTKLSQSFVLRKRKLILSYLSFLRSSSPGSSLSWNITPLSSPSELPNVVDLANDERLLMNAKIVPPWVVELISTVFLV